VLAVNRYPGIWIHHRGTEDTEREIYFFVYREIPIDEKNLSKIKFFFMEEFVQVLD
jgi:hypothetical protein